MEKSTCIGKSLWISGKIACIMEKSTCMGKVYGFLGTWHGVWKSPLVWERSVDFWEDGMFYRKVYGCLGK
jgi:hypothetical protein